jgi:hypothetical protein
MVAAKDCVRVRTARAHGQKGNECPDFMMFGFVQEVFHSTDALTKERSTQT